MLTYHLLLVLLWKNSEKSFKTLPFWLCTNSHGNLYHSFTLGLSLALIKTARLEMQPISIQTSLAGKQQTHQLHFCTASYPAAGSVLTILHLSPARVSGGRSCIGKLGSSPTVAQPQPQVCDISDERQSQSWHAAYWILNNQRETKAEMVPMWRGGEERGYWKDGHWLQGQNTGLHIKGDPDDSLDKALTRSLHFINKCTHEF